MARTAEPVAPLTQRAYTLRLRGTDPQDKSWRDALWATHEAVNKGAKAFGDWLLTLRGGLSHELAEPPAVKGTKQSDEEIAAMRKSRRILLALSWLSVEDERGAPTGPVRIAAGRDTDSERRDRVLAVLRSVLAARRVGKQEIESWVGDCAESLAAKIREDAVWVNRSALFDERSQRVGGIDDRAVWELLSWVHKPAESFFELPQQDDNGGDLASSDVTAGSAKKPANPDKAKDLSHDAGNWLVLRFPKAAGADFGPVLERYRKLRVLLSVGAQLGVSGAAFAEQMAQAIGANSASESDLARAFTYSGAKKGSAFFKQLPGVISSSSVSSAALNDLAAAVGNAITAFEGKIAGRQRTPKGRREWSDAILAEMATACGFEYSPTNGKKRHFEYCVMLDHAARRVSIGHSWIKRAEAERRRFEEDGKRLDKVPPEAAKWLNEFVAQRSGTSGAAAAGAEYRIRRRAIEGWDEVVKRWNRPSCKTEGDRIAAAREAQAENEDGKPGDIQLFEALAADDAVCVWKPNGVATTDPLRDYVLGHDAKDRQRRFKVPAYRHPDPLRHPVFGDFGNSRWSIKYAAHESTKVAGAKRKPSTSEAAWLADRNGLRMGLWDGFGVRSVALRWSSKRLMKDLALRADSAHKPMRDVTRADRLGRAASGLAANESASAAWLFALEDWNGRLQAPRAQLDAIAERVAKHGWDAAAKAMRDRIKWLVSFSAKLECRGPWYSYFNDAADRSPFLKRVASGPRKGQTYASANGWPHAIPNDEREGHAKLMLCRLPGLRILSVDLGHRFAASCAVWEMLSAAALKEEVAGRAIVSGETGKRSLYLHTRHIDPTSNNQRTTIYRRIGADKLPDGSDHPAPWARLDRQFLIKLQGEDRPARAASDGSVRDPKTWNVIGSSETNEVRMVADFAESTGLLAEHEERSKSRGVDELMRQAVRIATLGLKRHARVAKIAYALDPECPGIPGIGGSLKTITRADESHIKFLADALFDWHALATDSEWDGSKARELWNAHIRPLDSVGFGVEEPKRRDPNAERPTRQQKRKQDDEFRTEKLQPIAKALAALSLSTAAMCNAWTEVWEGADGLERSKDDFEHMLIRDENGNVIGSRTAPKAGKDSTSGWHAHLRLLTDWIMGWHLPGAQSKYWNRNVGGLGLTRIATMRALYQLHKAFDMRARPQRVQGAPKRGEDNSGIAQGILDAMESMREQRVKQIASRIVEAALGVGRHTPATGKDRDRKRPATRQDPPCHAVVIENLRNYRPDELQTRRENKALMSWSSGKVRKYLEEGCQLHGLHLREVQPNYTSRQCSRTGLPGMRCQDVPIVDFLASRYWDKVVKSARKRLDGKANGEGESLDRMIRDLHAHWSKPENGENAKGCTLRIPRAGADLFIAAGREHAIQADLNAAANIGLRALLDPDFSGKWWYVPCDAATGMPSKDKCGGAAYLDLERSLLQPAKEADEKGDKSRKPKGKSGEKVNAWRDVGDAGGWRVHQAYWNDVKARLVAHLRKYNGLAEAESVALAAAAVPA